MELGGHGRSSNSPVMMHTFVSVARYVSWPRMRNTGGPFMKNTARAIIKNTFPFIYLFD